MTDVLRELQEASYEGLAFPVESAETQGGHDFAQHVAYRRRGADMEWTGLRAYSGTLTVPIFETPALVARYGSALDLRFDLQQKFEGTPIGVLAHPTFGTFRAAITDWSEPLDANTRHHGNWVPARYVRAWLEELARREGTGPGRLFCGYIPLQHL